MKKQILVGLGFVAVILVLSFFLSLKYFWGKTLKIRDVQVKEIVTVRLDRPSVTSVRFHITGNINGPATFYWQCSEQTRESCQAEQRIEGGEIDIFSRSDWYNGTYTFVYEPSLEVRRGSIMIRYE